MEDYKLNLLLHKICNNLNIHQSNKYNKHKLILLITYSVNMKLVFLKLLIYYFLYFQLRIHHLSIIYLLLRCNIPVLVDEGYNIRGVQLQRGRPLNGQNRMRFNIIGLTDEISNDTG